MLRAIFTFVVACAAAAPIEKSKSRAFASESDGITDQSDRSPESTTSIASVVEEEGVSCSPTVFTLSVDEAEHEKRRRVRPLYKYATNAYDVGRFEEALCAFLAAYNLWPDPVLLFNVGQAARQLDKRRLALFCYRRFLSQRPADAPIRVTVERFIAELQSPRLTAP